MGVSNFGVISIPRMMNPAALVASLTWDSYITVQAPVLWYSMRATSGTTEINRGSGTGNATIGGTTTLGQTGQLGANEAHLLDGLTSNYSVANHVSFANLSTWEWYFLVNLSGAGEGNAGVFIFYTNAFFFRINAATGVLRCVVDGLTTDANAVTSTMLNFGVWNLVRVTYNDATDRIPHIWINNVEASYSSTTAMVGAYNPMVADLFLGNNAAQSLTQAGLWDEAVMFSNINDARSTQMQTLSGI